ncbi:flagellar motor switch protein FliM [Desulforhabdus amnigena]|jgi:flagellar motor switch protein FliM|uniref:Flagellar motor switch protein FliM n=1 Tax=Desulforhabdus amnigena TaxID=40218 RepID=A0A9W6D2V0_9BACT|nr:flagellar motor switch protein FliM [Desulforhabdus amnigena]NLJ26599.1 flagellar motor switch protein FliM [Deltaproteobacteria bacterium]GLI33578.1 flagellar motor switch protein FliM [Desulforhabdus amnigena]
MEKVLSQEEVDALLRGISDGAIESEPEVEENPDAVRVYDLTSQDRIIRGRMPTLEIINDRFARLHRVSLSASLRKIVDITVTQTDMVKFGEFLRTLPVPTSLHIVKMEPLRGHILLVIESRLIFSLMDCFFGGSGKSSFKVEGRDFTSIEQRVIHKVVGGALNDLDNAWKPVVPVNFQLVRSEVNPQFATIVAPTDLVIVIHFELELERSIGKIILCLPYSTIEPIRSRLYASYQSDQLEVDLDWIERLKRRMMEVEVEVLVELGTAAIKGRDLLHLEVGDVLILDQEVHQPLRVNIEGIQKFKASPGISRGNHAIQVTEVVNSPVSEGVSKRIHNYG